MSTQPELYIIIDERDPAFVFNGSWITSDDGPWYPEACLYGYGNFTLSFSGSSVAFIGNTGDRKATGEPFTHTVSIDGGPTYNTTFPLPDPSNVKIGQSYKQWYTSPFLPPLPFSPSPSRSSSNTSLAYNHTIMISDTHGVAVDFAIVSITDPETPISRDQKVLVDDQDPAVRYSGSWKSTTDSQFLNFNPFPGGVPIMNSTHQAQASGDCLEFRFAGTSIDVYGIWYPPSRDSTKISARATLDGTLQPRDPVVASQSRRYQNLLLFTASNLLPTDHTLTLTVDGSASLFVLDYMVYSPSFGSMREMPPGLGKGYKGCTAAGEDDGSSIPVGLIVGVVMGLFVCALLAILGVWRWNRGRQRRVSADDILLGGYSPA